MRFRFLPRVGATLRVFFPIACGDHAIGCETVDAAHCNVSTRCAEQGATCGDQGECVPVDATPFAPDAEIMDALVAADATTGRSLCSPSDFPTAATAGVPSGTALALQTDAFFTSHDGEVLDGIEFGARVYVSHANVVIRNSRLHGDVFYALYARAASNLTVEHCDISNQMLLTDSSHILIRANHFSSEGNAFRVLLGGSDVLFEDNLVEGLSGDAMNRSTGVTVFGGTDHVVIRHNAIDGSSANTYAAVSTASIEMQSHIDATFECNLFRADNAAAATLSLGGSGPFVVTHNRFALPANPHGELRNSSLSMPSWIDNTYTDGTPIPPP
jgi:hypothetical protein